MKKSRKIIVLMLIAAVVSLGLTGCNNENKRSSGDHPTSEHPSKKTSSKEHPTNEHPSKKAASEEHPTGEHPK